MTRKELQAKYGLSEKTFREWLRAIPELKLKPNQRQLSPLQEQLIIKNYGEPK